MAQSYITFRRRFQLRTGQLVDTRYSTAASDNLARGGRKAYLTTSLQCSAEDKHCGCGSDGGSSADLGMLEYALDEREMRTMSPR